LERFMDVPFLTGRILFGGYFLYAGLNHFLSAPMLAQYAAAKGVPAPEIAVVLSGALLVVGGASVLLGFWPHVGVWCIVTFLAIVSPVMHDFWAIADPAQRVGEMVNFMKNIALAGGGLAMLGVPRPWPYSVERARPVTATNVNVSAPRPREN
jgi:putative oxidoreductase